MNQKVRGDDCRGTQGGGVEEIFTLGEDKAETIDIFDDEYMARIGKIKLPNTRMQLLQRCWPRPSAIFKR